MARLIDATRIEQYILNNCSDNEEINAIYAEIVNAPTVDAELVKHGHWELVRNPMMYQTVPYVQVCSQCGTAFPYKMPYCGECGAKMEEVAEDAETN